MCQGQWTRLTLVSPLHLTLCSQQDRETKKANQEEQPDSPLLCPSFPQAPRTPHEFELWIGTL